MAKTQPFDIFTDRYENWFEKHRYVYLSELEALKKVYSGERSVEIGVGTGRFASPLGVKYGIEPSLEMGKIAKKRGIYVIRGIAEELPLRSSSFDNVLFITTICFVDDIKKAFLEAKRILNKTGSIIIGFVDKNTHLGQFYLKHKDENPFYRYANFFSTGEVINILLSTGFKIKDIYQTVFDFLDKVRSVQPPRSGYGEGAFVVIKAVL